MPSGTCDGDGIQNLKEIKVQHPHELIGSAQLHIPFAPGVERLLGIAENFFHTAVSI